MLRTRHLQHSTSCSSLSQQNRSLTDKSVVTFRKRTQLRFTCARAFPQESGASVKTAESPKVIPGNTNNSSNANGASSIKMSESTKTQTRVDEQRGTQKTTELPTDAVPLVMRGRSLISDDLGKIIDQLHPGMKFNTQASSDGAAVLGLQLEEPPVSFIDITLGKLAPGRMLCCARNKLWWMTPEWRTSTRDLPPEVQFLLLEGRPGGQGPYILLLPLIDGDFRATLRQPSAKEALDGEVVLRVESGDERVKSASWDSILQVSCGWDPYALIDRGITTAASLSGGAAPLSSKKLPPSLDVFGWCTWDAFYSSVSAKGIQDGLSSLHKLGIKPRFLIIDDGWQMTGLDPPDAAHVPLTPAELAERIAWLPEEEKEFVRETEVDFIKESMEVIAETAQTLPSGTSVGTTMPMLSNLGHEGAVAATRAHQHSHDGKEGHAAAGGSSADTKAGSEAEAKHAAAPALLATRLGQKIAGWIVGLGTAAFLLGYQWLVEPAPPGSTPVKTFAWLANGPLRAAMLGFYSGASDFTRRLTSVKANAKFSSPEAGPDEPWDGKPENLGSVVQHLKSKFGLQYVYCWHGLPAYWAGVMPNSPEWQDLGVSVIYARPTAGVLEVEPSMAWNPAVLAGVGVCPDPSRLYQSMHRYLSSSAVDGVKVDCQAGVGLVGSALGGGPALSRAFHNALEDSIAKNFKDNHAINCMCHSTENLYRMRDTAIARASDDFYPRDAASSQPHIAACAFNAVFLSALVQPDWDMFHSKHPAARLHAIARAISGGGVYVSDKPGEHDAGLLKQLVLPDGSLLRCAGPGRPTRDSLFCDVLRDGQSVLKVQNVNCGGPGRSLSSSSPALSGVVAAFNLQGSSWDRDKRKFLVHNPNPPPLDTQVKPKDVDAFAQLPDGPATTFMAHVHGQAATALHQLSYTTGLSLRLAPGTAEMVTITPVLQACGVAFAAVGLVNMMNSGGAIKSVNFAQSSLDKSTAVADVTVRGAGALVLYTNKKPTDVKLCGIAMMCDWHEASGALCVDVPATADLTASIQVKW